MQIKMGSEPLETPLYAYTYGHDGFYCGMSRRQWSELEGRFLMPASSTEIRPLMKEGFIPKWNGKSWDLVERKNAVTEAEEEKSELDEYRDRIFGDVVRSASDIVVVECHKIMNQVLDRWNIEALGFKREIEALVSLGLGDAKDRVANELWERSRGRLEAEVEELRVLRENVLKDLGVLRAEIETLRLLKATEPVEKPGLVARIFGSGSNQA